MREATQYDSGPCKLTISSHLFARWHLFRHVGYLSHQQQVDLWLFDIESGVRVTCDVGYLWANFSFPRPVYFRVTPDVRDRRQTDVRQKHRLMLTRVQNVTRKDHVTHVWINKTYCRLCSAEWASTIHYVRVNKYCNNVCSIIYKTAFLYNRGN